MGGQPRHLQVEHEGQPVQVLIIPWVMGVGPAEVLEGRGEVTELDEGLSTECIEVYLKAKRPWLLFSLQHLPLQVAPESDGRGRKGLDGLTVTGGGGGGLMPAGWSQGPL